MALFTADGTPLPKIRGRPRKDQIREIIQKPNEGRRKSKAAKPKANAKIPRKAKNSQVQEKSKEVDTKDNTPAPGATYGRESVQLLTPPLSSAGAGTFGAPNRLEGIERAPWASSSAPNRLEGIERAPWASSSSSAPSGVQPYLPTPPNEFSGAGDVADYINEAYME